MIRAPRIGTVHESNAAHSRSLYTHRVYRFAAQLFHILLPAEQDTENDEEADATRKTNKPQSAPKEKSSSSATGDRRLCARNSAAQLGSASAVLPSFIT